MADKLLLEVITPSRMVVSEEVDMVVAPGEWGEFGALPNHAAYLTAIKLGELRYKVGNKTEYVIVSGGFAEIVADRATFLVTAAEKAHEVDIARAMKAKERAEQRLQAVAAKREAFDVARAEAALQRAIWRLKIAERAK
ncbi:MAG: F0F1 ATP synthase subunit epsilon [Deltaproteobacteria bacterium]|jgi:F-type H+-transporting ATPase subunit epsilon|nr:MAG: F0F1 ATP synthase subunit epsilon [Deltaproteobacteria bacterium]